MTLRARITWMLLCTIVPLGLIVAVGLYSFVRAALMAKLDDALVVRAESLASAVKLKSDGIEFDFEDATMPQYQLQTTPNQQPIAYFELWQLTNGMPSHLIERSPSLGSAQLIAPDQPPPRDSAWDGELSNDVDIRILSRTITPMVEDDAQVACALPAILVVVAVPRESVDDPLAALAIGMTCAGLVFAVVGGVSVRWSLAKGLAPVRGLADCVNAIDAANLGTRLHATNLPIEIAPIQERINDLLARIASAMQREKRFTAAAAHELRTPVAELRTLLEVAASRTRTADESHRTIATSLTSIERLDRLVTALLRLTRIESGRERASMTDVRIASALNDAIANAQPMANARQVRFNVLVDPGQAIVADKDLIAVALSNLIANAAEYADENSAVEVTVSASDALGDSFVVLRITNAASMLAGVDIDRIGESLWRMDSSRTDSRHIGMGIALARSAFAACDAAMEIHLGRSGLGQITVEVRLKQSGMTSAIKNDERVKSTGM